VQIRTVLDARPGAPPRYLAQALLLAHSLAASSRASRLEVFVLGDASNAVATRLRELGAELVASAPHELDSVATSGNKLVALRAPTSTPVLLVDCDICFLEDVSDLDGRNVRAAIGGGTRVSEAQWKRIEETTGLKPLEAEWVSLGRQVKAKAAGVAPEVDTRLYLNSGVVWIRDPAAFGPIWARTIDAIARAFDGHPLSTRAVRGSDQAGLATAVAEHGGFDLLPLEYNWLPVCFQLDLPVGPRVLHLVRFGESMSSTFSRTLTGYWEARVIRQIERGSGGVPAAWHTTAERDRLVDQAVTIRNRLLDLIRAADLDAVRL
jgi:hypothetical protein